MAVSERFRGGGPAWTQSPRQDMLFFVVLSLISSWRWYAIVGLTALLTSSACRDWDSLEFVASGGSAAVDAGGRGAGPGVDGGKTGVGGGKTGVGGETGAGGTPTTGTGGTDPNPAVGGAGGALQLPDKDCTRASMCGSGERCVACDLTAYEGWCQPQTVCTFDVDCGVRQRCGYDVETSEYRCLPLSWCP